jgi:WhiB family redox-sensing transcriptional regulator
MFFPTGYDTDTVAYDKAVKAAKAVCAGCAVIRDCYQYAVSNGIRHGVWGGKHGRELRPGRKKL